MTPRRVSQVMDPAHAYRQGFLAGQADRAELDRQLNFAIAREHRMDCQYHRVREAKRRAEICCGISIGLGLIALACALAVLLGS